MQREVRLSETAARVGLSGTFFLFHPFAHIHTCARILSRENFPSFLVSIPSCANNFFFSLSTPRISKKLSGAMLFCRGKFLKNNGVEELEKKKEKNKRKIFKFFTLFEIFLTDLYLQIFLYYCTICTQEFFFTFKLNFIFFMIRSLIFH